VGSRTSVKPPPARAPSFIPNPAGPTPQRDAPRDGLCFGAPSARTSRSMDGEHALVGTSSWPGPTCGTSSCASSRSSSRAAARVRAAMERRALSASSLASRRAIRCLREKNRPETLGTGALPWLGKADVRMKKGFLARTHAAGCMTVMEWSAACAGSALRAANLQREPDDAVSSARGCDEHTDLGDSRNSRRQLKNFGHCFPPRGRMRRG